MKIELLDRNNTDLWNRYIADNADATFFHQTEWRDAVCDIYKLKPLYLTAVENGDIRGVLPLFIAPHGPFKKKLVSIPFSVLGGVCGDTPEYEKALVEHAKFLMGETGVDFIELRNFRKKPGLADSESPYYTFLLDLYQDPERIWLSMHNEMRRCVRRARERNISLDLNSRDIGAFYGLYAEAHRELGTPSPGFKWISRVFTSFPQNHRIATAYVNGTLAAAVMVREYKDTVEAVFGHVLYEYRNLYPLYLLYWSLIEKACEKEFKRFNFGRSVKSSGTFRFKERWGARPYKLNYQYYPPKQAGRADTSQSSGARSIFTAIWKRMPVAASNLIGPKIRRYYP